MSDLAARNGGRAGLAVLAAILLLGLALRVDYARESREPVFDAVAYGEIAANLERGEGFALAESATQPASNYSPGLPLLVASLYELSGGEHERFARLVLALIGSLAVLFTYLIARRLAGPTAGLIGAAAVAIYPALLEYQGMLMSEPLAATLLSGAILAMLWAGDARQSDLSRGWRWVGWTPLRGVCGGQGSSSAGAASLRPEQIAARGGCPTRRQDPRARWLMPGALLGALALTRPEYLGVAVLLLLVVLARGRRDDWRIPLTNAAAMLLGVALIVAPWTVRNAIALDRFVPVSTGGGQVLFAGSYLPSGGDPEAVGREMLKRHPGLTRRLAVEYLPPRSPVVAPGGTNSDRVAGVLAEVRLEQILAALATQRYPGMETDRALDRMGRERLWDAISEQPLDYAGFLAAKLERIWGHGPRDVMRKPGWEALHWGLVAFGLLGLIVVARRRRWEVVPLVTVLLAITAVSVLLVASPRRALVMLPLVAALAGAGATWLWTAVGRRRRARPHG